MTITTKINATPEEIARARKIHQTTEVEIDDNATVSDPGDGSGCWVSAWVWIDNPDAEQEEG